MSSLTMQSATTVPFVPVVTTGEGRATEREAVLGKDADAHRRPGLASTGGKTVLKIASEREDLFAAFELVYDSYVRSGLMQPNPYQMRVTPYHLLPSTEVFVAVSRREVVCTMSLIDDGELGIPMESIYEREVAWRRAEGIRFAEVSCLADRPQAAERSFPVVVRLMGLMAQCARRRGIHELLVAVHPHHARFYQRFIAFRPIGEEKSYEAVCDNPAVALALNLDRLSVDNPRAYKRFFGVSFPDQALRYRRVSQEVLSELSMVAEASYDSATCSALEAMVAC